MIKGTCHCGAVNWAFNGMPETATACNCTLCRRSGALWAYDYDGEAITITAAEGALAAYVQGDRCLALHFCRHCGNVTHWRSLAAAPDGRWRCAVNLRMAEPDTVKAITLRRLDGLDSWEDQPAEGRCVGDLWF